MGSWCSVGSTDSDNGKRKIAAPTNEVDLKTRQRTASMIAAAEAAATAHGPPKPSSPDSYMVKMNAKRPAPLAH